MKQQNNPKSFLGTGWAFPVRFMKTPGATLTVSDIEDIEQSLNLLLSTRPGERVMRPDFGCALDDLIFEPMNANLQTYAKMLIERAILFYEPRVDLINIQFVADAMPEGRLEIVITLVVRATNSRFNYVYDYYKHESSTLPI